MSFYELFKKHYYNSTLAIHLIWIFQCLITKEPIIGSNFYLLLFLLFILLLPFIGTIFEFYTLYPYTKLNLNKK